MFFYYLQAPKFLFLVVVLRPSLFVTGEGEFHDPSTVVYPADEEKLKGFRDELCKNVPALGGKEENSTWTDTLTKDGIYELAFLSMGYGLTADAIAHLPIDLGWRKILIDQMAYITRTTCDTPAISSLFLSGVKNLFLYYMLKYEKSLEKGDKAAKLAEWKAEKHKAQWTEIINGVSKCAAVVNQIKFDDDCGALDNYKDSKGKKQATNVVYEEFDHEVDSEHGLDIVVDSIWWMFTTTYARCYAYFYPNEDIILLLLQRFREDIMKHFESRWRGGGELTEQFEIVFGPILATQEHDNLRKCATSAFNYEGLVGRHLIRPVTVTVSNAQVRNFKTESGIQKRMFDDDE